MPGPQRITPTSLADYLAVMSRAVFSSGINWSVIEAKWDGIREAFDDFDPLKIAAYTPDDVERLMGDAHVVRNHMKIMAIIDNAGELIVTDREFDGFEHYLDSFSDNDALVADLHKRFQFLGPSVAHFFLYGIGYNVPAQDAWAHEHFGATHPHEHHG